MGMAPNWLCSPFRPGSAAALMLGIAPQSRHSWVLLDINVNVHINVFSAARCIAIVRAQT